MPPISTRSFGACCRPQAKQMKWALLAISAQRRFKKRERSLTRGSPIGWVRWRVLADPNHASEGGRTIFAKAGRAALGIGFQENRVIVGSHATNDTLQREVLKGLRAATQR